MRDSVRAIVENEAALLIVPTLPVLTPLRSDTTVTIAGNVSDYTMALIRYTSLFNHTGNPVVAMPATVLGTGIGVGVQVVAGQDREAGAGGFVARVETLRGPCRCWG